MSEVKKTFPYKALLIFMALVVALSGLGFAAQSGLAQAPIPSIDIVDVDPGDSVTILGRDFPPRERFTAYFGEAGTRGVNGVQAGVITTPADGTFVASFDIPAELAEDNRVVIRLESQRSGFFAFNTFTNATRGVVGDPIDPADCAEFYTVQRGDILFEIAQRFDTTVDRLVELNAIEDRSLIFTGQRLCVQAEDDVILPPTGGQGQVQAVVNVLDVDEDEDVTIRARSFPADVNATILIGRVGDAGTNVAVATVRVPQDGNFVTTVGIPNRFEDVRNLVVRVETPGDIFAFASFQNVGAIDDDDDVRVPDDFVTVPGLELGDPVNERSRSVAFGERVSISIGNGGFFTDAANFSGNLQLARYRSTPQEGLQFSQNLLRVELIDPLTGDQTDFIRGLNYVFFDIKQTTRALYDVEDLAIYRFDRDEGGWELCEIMIQIPGDEEDTNRLACVVNEFGVFGIAAVR